MAETVKDLVCDMDIDPETAAGKSEYKGETYHFCSGGCKVDFDGDPEKYIGGHRDPMPEAEGGEPAKPWWQFWK